MTIDNQTTLTESTAVRPDWVMPEHLQRLAAADPMVVDELIETFVADTAERLRRLRIAFQDDDFARVSREAHSIIGSSSLMGAGNMPTLCRLAEAAASRRVGETVQECIDALDRSFAYASQAMQLYAALQRTCHPTGGAKPSSEWS
ncbi:MAG TPA: Hpt domain-containing protein [Bryobacteraceae bacterium]|nr:Hpt domain-containing protein [Bryobacteraceae bacterium]